MKLFGYKVHIRPVERAWQSRRAAGKWVVRQAKSRTDQAKVLLGRVMTRANATRAVMKAYEVRASHDGWMITRTGSSLPLRVFTKKPDAIKEAKKLARAKKTHVDVFTRQGSLQMRQSFT